MDLELQTWLNSGKYRVRILLILNDGPKAPSDIARILSLNRVSVSRILKDLKNESLVEATKKKTKMKNYFLTEKGREICGEINGQGRIR